MFSSATLTMNLLQMSISGDILILAICLFRRFTPASMPKKMVLLAWMIALVRLLVPFSLPCLFSLYSRVETELILLGAVQSTPIPAVLPLSARLLPQNSLPLSPWFVVYFIGLMGCAVYFIISYTRCRREFSTSLPVENPFIRQWVSEHRFLRPLSVRQSDRIDAPLTYGLFCPVILLPKHANLNDQRSIRFILEHEYIHIRHLDALWKILLTAAVCIHWFNPLVWLMYALCNQDIELACDEAVVNRLGTASAPYYAKTLLRMEENRSFPHPLYNSFSKNALKKRIIALSKDKGISRFITVVGVFLLVCLFIIFATSSLQIGGDASHVERIIGESEIFTEAEINDMMDAVIRFFPAFEGCILRELSYDEETSLREASLYKEYSGAPESIQKTKSNQIAVLLSTFDTTEAAGNDGFNTDFTYRRWMWILKRNALGEWTILSWGY